MHIAELDNAVAVKLRGNALGDELNVDHFDTTSCNDCAVDKIA